MGHTATQVTGPAVSIWDVKSVLNVNSQDLGALCRSSQVKKWARYKPVSHPNYSSVDASERKAINQGFLVDTTATGNTGSFFQTTAERAFNAAKNNSQDWTYIHPTGTMGVSTYRLFDFRNMVSPASAGYNHAAVSFVGIDGVIGDAPEQDRRVQLRVDFRYILSDLSFDDFAIIENVAFANSGTWYWCLFMKVPTISAVQLAYLYTDQNYTTKISVGSISPSSSNISRGFGYFSLPTNASGEIEAYLGLVCISSVTQGECGYIFAPTKKPASFSIWNPTAGSRVGLLPAIQGLSQGTKAYWTTQGGINYISAFTSSIRVDYSQTSQLVSRTALKVTETIWGEGGDSRTRETTTYVESGTTATGVTINTDWPNFALMRCNNPSSLQYSIEVQLGAEAPTYFYFDASSAQPQTLQMSTTDIKTNLGEVNSVLGDQYAQIIQTQ